MKRKIPKAMIAVFATLLVLLSISKQHSNKLRGHFIAVIAPCWEEITNFKLITFNFFNNFGTKSIPLAQQEELERFKLENHMLKMELKNLTDRFGKQEGVLPDTAELRVVPARVIFRSPDTWDSSLWINAGTEINETLGQEIVSKNSPVVIGKAIVGVVDYVGKRQSRVKLITDPSLSSSVRVLRTHPKGTYRLAKGEISGKSRPLWRKEDAFLHGIGFNYDFADAAGPARDLRTGVPVENRGKQPGIPLVKVDDQLVTTGLDGVFPPDLHVGTVTKIFPLKEGDYYYELEAKPSIENLDDLTVVFVIPSIGFEGREILERGSPVHAERQ